MAIRFAVAALTAESFRAYALFNGLSLLDDAHFFVAAVAQKFDCCKYTRRTCADDANVVFSHFYLEICDNFDECIK